MIQLFKPKIREAAIESVAEVLRSGWIGLGPKTEQFERAFAEHVGAAYVVGVNSATAGLHLAMILAGVGPGDEVITTPLTFVSTNHVILYQGGVPVFADVDPETCNIDPASVRRMLSPKTKAILAVHFGGYPCELDDLRAIAKEAQVPLIEDAAHACGSQYKGKPIGAEGLAVFSFHAVKNLPMGDGGAIATQHLWEDQRLRRLRWLGIDKDTYHRTQDDSGNPHAYAWQYDVPELGYKYHMNDIAAAIGLVQLSVLASDNTLRRLIAAFYNSAIDHPQVIRKCRLSDGDHLSAQHLYWLQVERRDELVTKMKAAGIAPGVHYVPNHVYPMYRECRGEFEHTEEIAQHLISLPLHMGLTIEDTDKIIEVINDGW